MLKYILDENNEPVPCEDLFVFASWFEDVENRIVAKDKVDDVEVSTVFLGIDHDFSGQGPPVLWETMIFGGRYNESQGRYCSHADALKGHAAALAAVKDEAATIEAEIVKPPKRLTIPRVMS